MTWPITVEDLKAYLGNEKPTDDDAFYERAIDGALETLQGETLREFTLVTESTTASARLFIPEDDYLLPIHDCTSVTSIVNNGATLASGTYQLEPVGVRRTGEQRPYDAIRIISGAGWYMYRGQATVSVTAKWGWSAIPKRITEALYLISKDIVLNRDVRLGVIDVTEAGGVSARTNTVVRATINNYRASHEWPIA